MRYSYVEQNSEVYHVIQEIDETYKYFTLVNSYKGGHLTYCGHINGSNEDRYVWNIVNEIPKKRRLCKHCERKMKDIG